MANILGDYGGYSVDDPRNQKGKGIVRKGINNLVSQAESGATPIGSIDTVSDIIRPRPFIDRSGTTPKTQIFGAIKDRLHNFFQPGDPGYNYDDTSTADTAIANPAKQAPVDVATTNGNVGLPRMSQKDLSRLSNGMLPLAKSNRTVHIRNTNTQQAVISQPDEEGLRTQPIAPAPVQQLPAGQRIFEMSGADAAGMGAADIVGNGGFGTQDGKTFILPSRGADEEAALRAQQAQVQNAQPIAQPSQQTSTVGYGNGIETYGGDGNLISSTRKLDSNATMGDLMMEKFNTNQQVKKAGIANVNSEVANRQAITQMAQQEQPYKIASTIADIRNKNFATDNGIAMSPLIQENTKANTDHTKANTLDIIEMMNPKKNTMLSDIRYKEGMLKIAGDKLGILKEQIAIKAKQAATKGNSADWGGISKSALEGIKLIDAKAALGGLTPEDEQLRKNYLDTYNLAFPRQQRTAYQQQAVAIDGGE